MSTLKYRTHHKPAPQETGANEAEQLWQSLAPKSKQRLVKIMTPFFKRFDEDGSNTLDNFELSKVV